ncbi:transglycosylase SLT domain-containing protein [Nocardia farcinica]|uniref:transglycosylase SLT domain-containing protein n=1 Tax=Nocardia farcinica TaxID=37329 RepID=UPI001E5DC7DA|nr:transglycosylase SLT domain-containing protein [Nocardia farcinica]
MPQYDAGSAGIKIKPNFRNFVTETETELRRHDFSIDVRVGADTAAARSDIQDLQAEARRDQAFRVGADIFGAVVDIENLQQLARQNQSFRVDADTAAAAAKVAALRQGGTIPLTPEMSSTALARARTGMLSLTRQLRQAALINIGVVGVFGAAGVIAELAAVANAAAQVSKTVSLIPAISVGGLAGIGAAATGFTGIPAAFKAISAASKEAGSAAGAQANEFEDLAEAQYQAEQASKDVRSAQRDLNTAYRDGSRAIRDMNLDLVDQRLSVEDAAISVEEAAKRLQEVQFDPTADSTTRRRAQHSYDQAVARLRQQQIATQDLEQDTAEANAKGVEGSDQVVAAHERVEDALHAQQRAMAALRREQEGGGGGGGGQDKVAEAMAKLSPQAQKLVTDIQSLGPAWTEARKASQDALSDGMGPAVVELANRQLPVLRDGFIGINSAFNTGIRASLLSLSSEKNVLDFRETLANTTEGFRNAARGAGPLTDALTKMATVGSQFLPGFGTAIGNAAERFNTFTQRAAADGSLRNWMQEGITATRELFSILGNLGSSIASIFRAADTGDTLQRIDEITERWREFLASTQGQNQLGGYYTEAREALERIQPLLEDLPELLRGIWEGFETWASIAGPFLRIIADLLAAHPTLVQAAVVAYLGFRTIGPIFTALRGGIANTTAAVGRLQGQAGGAIASLRGIATATGGVANVAGVGATALGRFGSAVQQAGTHSPAIARMQQAYMNAAAGAQHFGRTAGAAAAAATGVRSAVSSATAALGGPWVIAIIAATAGLAKFTADARAHEQRLESVKASWQDLVVSRDEMTRSLAASGGGVDDDGLATMTTRVQQLNAAIEDSANNRTKWSEWRALTQAPWNDNIRKENFIADQYKAAQEAIEKLGVSEQTVARTLTSDGAWADMKAKLEAMGEGGKFAAENYQWLRDEMQRARDVARDTTPGFATLTDAVKVLADTTATSADRLDAMKTALDVLAGKPLEAQEALAKYNDQIRETERLASEFDPSQGIGSALVDGTRIDTTTANGRKLFNALNDIRDATLNAAVAGNDLAPILARNQEQFATLAAATGLTTDQVVALATGLGYMPDEIRILASLQGADDVQQQLVVIGQLLDKNRDGVTIPARALTTEARAELERLGVTVETVTGKPDEIRIVARTEEARRALDDIENRPRTVKVNVVAEGLTFDGTYFKPENARRPLPANASGSRLPTTGPGTERRDGILGVAAATGAPMTWLDGGEWVINRDSAARYDRELAAINAGTFPKLPGYETGGRIGDVSAAGSIVDSMRQVVAAKFPGMTLTSGHRDTNDFHGQGMAADFSNGTDSTPEMRSLADYIATHFPQSLELIHSPFNRNIKNGSNVGDGLSTYGAQTMAEHRNHVHWAMASAPSIPTAAPAAPGALTNVAPGTAAPPSISTQSVLSPQAALPGRRSDQELQRLQGEAAVDAANSERNAVYANPNSTDADKLAADLKYQQAQNALESSQKTTGSESTPPSLQGIFSRAGSILATGLLSAFGLENSILSESNPYNRAIGTALDFYSQKNGQLQQPEYSYTPKNLPSMVTTTTPQSAAPSNVPGTPEDLGTITVQGAAAYTPGAGVEQWRGLATQALIKEGFNPNQVDIMLAQIQSESGGDPAIVQQVIDVNSGGNEAVGLLQVIPGTFATYRDPALPNDRTHPYANMVAALRYYRARYGMDLSTMWGQGHGYRDGGWAIGPGGPRDDGFLAPLSNGEFVVNADAAARNAPLLEAINASSWSANRVDPNAFVAPTGATAAAGHDLSTTINARVADVDDLVELAERRSHAKAIGLMAALP